MDKITRLKNEKELLIAKKLEAERQIEEYEKQLLRTNEEIAQAYQQFFDNKRNKEFILYERFPSMSALEIFGLKTKKSFP